jgi:hypothetical protein
LVLDQSIDPSGHLRTAGSLVILTGSHKTGEEVSFLMVMSSVKGCWGKHCSIVHDQHQPPTVNAEGAMFIRRTNITPKFEFELLKTHRCLIGWPLLLSSQPLVKKAGKWIDDWLML